MPKRNSKDLIVCGHFSWRLFVRNGVYYADGRRAANNVGKHSLSTRVHAEALARLRELDYAMAVQLGLATEQSKPTANAMRLTIEEGWQLYFDECARSNVMHGVNPATLLRYRSIRKKHAKHCQKHGLTHWEQIGKPQAAAYGQWLQDEEYSERTIYLELSLVKSVNRWLIEEGHLDAAFRIKLPLRRPMGSDRYCYTRAQVRSMIEHCQADKRLHWLGAVITVLAHTGLRISELASLRPSNIDLQTGMIRLVDERSSATRRKLGNARTTKNRRGRGIPIHPSLKSLIENLRPNQQSLLFQDKKGNRLQPSNLCQVLVREVITPLKSQFPTPPGEIGFEHGRFHSFRHFFVSQAFIGGASEGEVKEWVGHSDSQMVAHYRHLHDDDSQRRMAKLDFLGEQ